VERIDRDVMLNRRIAKLVPDISDESRTLTVVGAGKPHPSIRIAILSRTGRSLPEGHVGEIGLDTASRMLGYLKDARATRRAIYGKYLRTGDLGYLREGELYWVGRVRERITVRGVKLDPSDFEPILLQIPDLRSGCFAAFGIDDDVQGTQQIVIISEVRETTDRSPEEISGEVRQQVFSQLGINVNQVLLVRHGTLSKTSSGKRRHKHFRRHYQNGTLQEFIWVPNIKQG
jgi:acyl-CoA synthetase (AMP-forming)/AMP-acid ligase II